MAAAYSFYPTKNLGALGDGGAVTTNDDASGGRMSAASATADRRIAIVMREFGVNSRLDEMQAAVLFERLQLLEEATRQRRAVAARYRDGLDGTDAVVVPAERDAGHVYHLFPVLTEQREELQRHLKGAGIETLVHYPVPVTRQPALASERPGPCPTADRVCDRVLSLPLYPALAAEAIDRVVAAVRSFPMGIRVAPPVREGRARPRT